MVAWTCIDSMGRWRVADPLCRLFHINVGVYRGEGGGVLGCEGPGPCVVAEGFGTGAAH